MLIKRRFASLLLNFGIIALLAVLCWISLATAAPENLPGDQSIPSPDYSKPNDPGIYRIPCEITGMVNRRNPSCGESGFERTIASTVQPPVRKGRTEGGVCWADFGPGEYTITTFDSGFEWTWECRHELRSTTGEVTKIMTLKKKSGKLSDPTKRKLVFRKKEKQCGADLSQSDKESAVDNYRDILSEKYADTIAKKEEQLAVAQDATGDEECWPTCRAILSDLERIERRMQTLAESCADILDTMASSGFLDCRDKTDIAGKVKEMLDNCQPEKACDYIHDMTERLTYRYESLIQAWTNLPQCMKEIYPEPDDLEVILLDTPGWLP